MTGVRISSESVADVSLATDASVYYRERINMFDIFMNTYIYKATQRTVNDRKKEFNELIRRMNATGGGYILVTSSSGHDSDVSGWVGRIESVVCVQFISTEEYKTKWAGCTGGNIRAKLTDGRVIDLYDPKKLYSDCIATPSNELREEMRKYQEYSRDEGFDYKATFYVQSDYQDMAELDKALKEEDKRRAQVAQWRKEDAEKEARATAQARERDVQQRAAADEVRSRLDNMFGGQAGNSGASNSNSSYDQKVYNIIECECGQQIRYPLNMGTVTFACPRCSRKYKLFTGVATCN